MCTWKCGLWKFGVEVCGGVVCKLLACVQEAVVIITYGATCQLNLKLHIQDPDVENYQLVYK